MFKTLKATLAAALVTLGVAATASQPANAFTAPSADAITADTLTTNVSCGGIDCDHPSQRGYRRYNSEGRGYGRRRYRSYRANRRDSYRDYRGERDYEHRMRKRRAAAACRELGLELLGGRCRPTRLDDVVRSIIKGGQRCPRGMYRNPLGPCQPNETGG